MEKFDAIPEPETAPVRGDYPRIGNSSYRFNLWYKFPKMIEKQKDKPGYDNYDGDHNFESDDLIDYMRESMSGIKLIEDFDEHEDYFTGKVWKRYRVGAFIPERDCGIDGVYAREDMKSFKEIDFEKSVEWIAKMLESWSCARHRQVQGAHQETGRRSSRASSIKRRALCYRS